MAAQVYITEFTEIGSINAWNPGGIVQVAVEPALAEQVMTSTGSSAASAAFNAATRFVEVYANGDSVNFKFGSAPTASASTNRLGDGERIWRQVTPGHKIAIITGA